MRVPASGAVIGMAEKKAMHDAVDAGWLTAGPINAAFENKLSAFTGIKHVRTCNSGSSANLLAVAAMVASGRWKAGDEIITSAVGFPTTVNPLLLYGLVPKFIDVELGTYNPSAKSVMNAVTDKTTGLMMAHTLGNPFDNEIVDMVIREEMGLVEDCCDALGSISNARHVGTHAHIATFSFFPAHHITTGEGGAVMTQDADLLRHIEALRDWGRDCWCAPGQNNTCGKRFDQQFGELPYGFDHKYVTNHLGYNLKMTEISAACGNAQMMRLKDIVERRKRNFQFIYKFLEDLQDKIILPCATAGTDPSWFGFPITLKEHGIRLAMQDFLFSNEVDTRLIFGGNLTKQPYMKGRNWRIAEPLVNADTVMHDSLWIGVHPELRDEQMEFACSKIREFLNV